MPDIHDFRFVTNQVKETAEELGISTRQVSRDKNSALAKMLKRMKAAGYESYTEAQVHFCRKAIIFQHRWRRRILL